LIKLWRDWRKEDNRINWEIDSRVFWHKHIKMNTDMNMLKESSKPIYVINPTNLGAIRKKQNLTLNQVLPIGQTRMKLKAQKHANINLQEITVNNERYYVSS